MTYCIAGIAVIISQSIMLFNIMKWLGALYLIYIGIQSWRAKHTMIHIDAHKHKHTISAFHAVKMGFLTNALNPKATLFFLSAFTLIISPSTPMWIQLAIGVWCVAQTFLWFAFVAIVLTIPRVRRVFERFQ
jgi:threonine/homoserine/homoserine lactone efflux protein